MKIHALCNTGETIRYVLLADHEAAVAALTQERDYFRGQYHAKLVREDELLKDMLQLCAERDALALKVEALSMPVTDEECELFDLDCQGHFSTYGVDALIAARSVKEQRLDPQGVDADWQDTGEPR